MPLTESRWNGGKVHLAWVDDDGPATIEGTLSGNTITGTFKQGQTTAPAYLIRGASLDSAGYSRVFGLYERDSGHFVWLGPISELGLAPGYIDAKSGRAGILFPRTNRIFTRGANAISPVPASGHFDFAAPGATPVSQFFWQEGMGHTGARRVDTYRTEPVTFTNGAVRLSGTLVIPKSPGLHPAVVMIHGGGSQHRAYFSALPYLLANAGVAALVYDKRGVAASTGNRRTSRFVEFADDALAGVRYLKSRSDIARDRVGLYGHSQGGWHAQLAAVRGGADVAFVVMAATPAAVTSRAKSESWARLVWKPGNAAEVPGDTLESVDPAPLLAKLTVPVLALYATNDIRVNAKQNAALLTRSLKAAGNRDFTVNIIPAADHDFWTAREASTRDMETRGYAPEYLKTVIDWIVARARPGR